MILDVFDWKLEEKKKLRLNHTLLQIFLFTLNGIEGVTRIEGGH